MRLLLFAILVPLAARSAVPELELAPAVVVSNDAPQLDHRVSFASDIDPGYVGTSPLAGLALSVGFSP